MNEHKIAIARDLVNGISDSFCIAKWLQTTLYLHTGYNHSCHHPTPHKIPLEEIENKPSALHNTQHKKARMQEMLDGVRPKECEYCWKIEDLGDHFISDRYYKSSSAWALPNLGIVLETETNDINPTYLEISFSNVCNFKCVYCNPESSSTWFKEIQRHGGYPTSSKFNDMNSLIASDRMPYDPNGENPYVDAFWKWWPEVYPGLHTLRITGGEPLMSRDAWDLINHLIENPNPELTFCINTNLGVQDKLIDKLIESVNKLDGKVKEVQIFTSGEAIGKQNEYIRFGVDDEIWLSNSKRIITETKGRVIFAVMTTVGLLSAPTFAKFVDRVLNLRGTYGPAFTNNKVQFMVNYLRYPSFLALPILDDDSKAEFVKSLEKLIQARGPHTSDFGKLSNLETDQINRLIDYVLSTDDNLERNREDFAIYVDEIDNRRDTNFSETFPQLMEFYKICQNYSKPKI